MKQSHVTVTDRCSFDDDAVQNLLEIITRIRWDWPKKILVAIIYRFNRLVTMFV